MGMLTTEEIAELLVLPEGLLIQAVSSNQDELAIRLTCTSAFAHCPQCQTVSQRIHGQYRRTLADLPCAGRRVVLALTIRKFVCGTTNCPCRIFTERLHKLAQPYARMTNRLRAALEALGFVTSEEAGARVSEQLGMPVTPFRLLQALRKTVLPAPAEVRIVGIDDWCWKKGTTYGTIIVDLESRQPIELLPDRSVESVEAWLRSHPEIIIVSRDRGGDYAAAARNGAPQAEQIADRFHLLLNLRAKLKDLMVRQHKLLPMSAITRSDAVPQKARGRGRSTLSAPPTAEENTLLPPPLPVKQSSPDVQSPELFDRANRSGRYEVVNQLWKKGKSIHFIAKHLKMSRVTVRRYLGDAPSPEKPTPPGRKTTAQVRREARAEMVLQLREQGNSIDTIARHLKLARGTVRRYLKDAAVFEPIPVPRRKNLLDPFKPYILARWEAGCRNGSQLYREIESHGYTGSDSMLRLFISKLRKHQQPEETGSGASPGSVRHRISPARASWLFICVPDKLDEAQRQLVQQICAVHTDLDTAYRLTQAFVSQIKNQAGADAVDAWVRQAEQSGIPEFKSFAKGIHHDESAVKAAFSSPWSNGQVEGQVNRLKFQKRMGYGRAHFDLLRIRVLSGA